MVRCGRSSGEVSGGVLVGRTSRPIGVMASIVLLALTACTDENPPDPPPARAVQAWSLSDVRPIGHPANIGGVAVAYVSEAPDVYIIGMDPQTGEELWRREASPGQVTPGVALLPRDVDDKVIYLRPEPGRPEFTRIVVADPRTGADIIASEPVIVSDPPDECEDETDVCAVTATTGSGRGTPHRLRISDGAFVEEAATPGAIPPTARLVGQGLYDLGNRSPQPEELAYVRDGAVRWRIQVSDVFPRGYSTDNGWVFFTEESDDVILGTIYPPLPRSADQRFSVRLDGRAVLAAVSKLDGSVVWRNPGGDLFCNSRLWIDDPPDDLVPVRCRFTGVRSYDEGTDEVTFSELEVTLEGFSVATGEALWTLDLGPAESLAGGQIRPVRAGDTAFLVRFGSEPLGVDRATGESFVPAADATFWCESEERYEYGVPFQTRERAIYERRGGRVAHICDVRGEPAESTPLWDVTRNIGAQFEGIAVLATESGFAGYRVESA